MRRYNGALKKTRIFCRLLGVNAAAPTSDKAAALAVHTPVSRAPPAASRVLAAREPRAGVAAGEPRAGVAAREPPAGVAACEPPAVGRPMASAAHEAPEPGAPPPASTALPAPPPAPASPPRAASQTEG